MTQPSQPERSEPHTLDCQCVGCAYGFTKIIAELEAEVALDDKLLADRKRLLEMFVCPVHGECIPFAISEVERLRALANEASPPAPVAQEKPRGCHRCGSLFKSLVNDGDDGLGPVVCADCFDPAWKDPKPPEAEEPAIVRRLLDALPPMTVESLLMAPCVFCRYNGASYWQLNTHSESCPWLLVGGAKERASLFTEKLLAFIDSRKAAVSEPCPKCSSWGDTIVAASVGWSRKNDRLEAQRDDARQERDRLREELSALKARPVVDVAKAVSDLKLGMAQSCDGQWGPESRLISARAALSNALESLQPASAKADSTKRYYCPMCGYETTEPGCVCPAPCPRVAKMLERPASAKADEKPTPMPSADPARVGEEEQENGDCGTSSGGRTRAVTRTCAQQ